MTRIEELVLELVGGLVTEAGGEDGPVRVRVEQVDLKVPVEVGIGVDGAVLASTPRGRVETGFQSPVGALRVLVERRGS